MTRRTFFASAGAGALAAAGKLTTMGLTADSFQIRRARTIDELIDLALRFGSLGVQGSLASLNSDYARKIRKRLEENNLFLDVTLPLAGDDASMYEKQMKLAQEAGAGSIRTVGIGSRRYEAFNSIEEFNAAWAKFQERLERSIPIMEKLKMPVGLENHKDMLVDQQVALLKKYSSAYLGVTLDFGNNMSLLEDPMETARKLTPFVFAAHIKDMAVEEYPEGFLLSEVPLGDGMVDLKRIVDMIRRQNSKAHISLEMITRDPLKIPCLTDKYWATFPGRGGLHMARMLTMVRANKPRKPLPHITGLDQQGKIDLELKHVELCVGYARDSLGLA